VLAISVAQVDQMSGGRVELGLGAGWYDAEHAALGLDLPPLKERFERYTEQLEVVTGLWETPDGETFSYDGKHYKLVDSPALPKPAQRPKPPVIIGGGGKKKTPVLAARFADEFNLPSADMQGSIEQFGRVEAACKEIGRDPAEITRSVWLTAAVGRNDAEIAKRAEAAGRDLEWLRNDALGGTPAQVVDKLGRWREEAGVTRVYLQILDLSDLDHLELIASEVAPQL
jgi:alkanesulfonate monooxygenase SsuD/methylene tetrahydromethanopterin reductase-like flavin-dependent oxidoreductase (luciferase family)